MEEMKRRKEALQNASEERKNFMQTMELKRKENAKPSDLEQVKKYNVCIIFCVQWRNMFAHDMLLVQTWTEKFSPTMFFFNIQCK